MYTVPDQTSVKELPWLWFFESPFEMVSGYPEAYEGQKESPLLSAVPTTWDETRVVNAKVGDYITIGRRNGNEWYVGSIAGSHGAELDIPLELPGPGDYLADVYSDAPDAAYNRTLRIKAPMVSGGARRFGRGRFSDPSALLSGRCESSPRLRSHPLPGDRPRSAA